LLRAALHRHGGAWAEPAVSAYGAALGSAQTLEWGRLANAYSPELRTHDRYGHRIDEVSYHPAWHELMRLTMAHEVHNLPWLHRRSGAQAARTAKHYLLAQVEAGHACPITMTYAALPALRRQPDVAAEWEPLLMGTEYDGRSVPVDEKKAVVLGMAMTEKQGGSDVRANTTRARALERPGPGRPYALVGHKWFCSAPMSDAFLTLAHTDRGLTCFLVPRFRPDGTRNRIRLQRLKDKLGNRSNASAEIEYDDAWSLMIGEEGRGVRTIIDMVHHTRLDCVSGSAGLMRQALSQALHHCRYREAFGKRLLDQPLMRNVLCDLALEVEAAVALMMRLAAAYDHAAEDEHEAAFARIATAVGKYWVCKRAPYMIYEAMECLGGNGYVEESLMPRLYREAPVNAIWEGSGNVICLDVLRAIAREPETLPTLMAEIRTGGEGHEAIEHGARELEQLLAEPQAVEYRARAIVERMAVLLQASLLARHAPREIADAYCAGRLERPSMTFGALPEAVAVDAILDRCATSAP
jgi:putative acyl-CoA dehydrogenase